MSTSLAEKQILKLNERLSGDITISLTKSEHPSYPSFKDFCDNLNRLVPQVKVTMDGESPEKPPQIVIGNGLRYQAVPAGLELPPFLDALTDFSSNASDAALKTKDLLKKDKLPATLTLYIAAQCGFCPAVVRQLMSLPMVDDQIQLIIIDGALFPEMAEAHKIEAVPTLLLDDQFRWTGSVPLKEIINTINTRDPASLGAASLENLLKEGQAGRLAAMMLEARQVFPAFYELLIHSQWHIRLGAMVVMEEIIDHNASMTSEVIDRLWDQFDRLSDQVKGDVLYLFGVSRDQRTAALLDEVLAGDQNEEVKEAAKEALEALDHK
jgi:hypothetical protein